ncbi:MAG: tetratricopeptide repeat protein [Dehalococcoidia bacterium]|nr:tetratricopeptide repeat protein [Dehalococcoidia bacterium]
MLPGWPFTKGKRPRRGLAALASWVHQREGELAATDALLDGRASLDLQAGVALAALAARAKQGDIGAAAGLVSLGNRLQESLSIKRRDNLEQAIACYLRALEVYTRAAFPVDWATTQNNLGITYRNRIAGERRDNLEAAIACYQRALEVYTREAFPVQWATTQNNLGNTYRDRIAGERRDNLEAAIACYQGALEVYTADGFPHEHSVVMRGLAAAEDALRGL